jgi:hypothetical protein
LQRDTDKQLHGGKHHGPFNTALASRSSYPDYHTDRSVLAPLEVEVFTGQSRGIAIRMTDTLEIKPWRVSSPIPGASFTTLLFAVNMVSRPAGARITWKKLPKLS